MNPSPTETTADEQESADQAVPETVPEPAVPADGDDAPVIRTVAFLADGRASDFLLAESISTIVEHHQIQEAIVDLSMPAGVATAAQLLDTGIPYGILDTVPPQWDEGSRPALQRLLDGASGRIPFDPENIAAIAAHMALIPAAATDAGPGIDATEGTVTALVLDQLQAAGRDCLVILPPEHGLRRRTDGTYVRLALRLGE